jgi:dipeptidase E
VGTDVCIGRLIADAHVLRFWWLTRLACFDTSIGGTVKLLLTSSGISNPSIHESLVELLGKPIAESSALFVPSGMYPFPGGGASAWEAIQGRSKSPLCGLGWKSLGLLELTALTSIQRESWVPILEETDALLVWGGDVLYLCYWMRQSGLAELFASLEHLVYVGVSAGSIAMCPYNYDAEFNLQMVPSGHPMALEAEKALGLVDFALSVHLDNPNPIFEDNSEECVARWAAGVPVSTYAIDDQTAIKVSGGTVEVISEGRWKLFSPTTRGI